MRLNPWELLQNRSLTVKSLNVGTITVYYKYLKFKS